MTILKNKTIILDGATGTLFQARGMKAGEDSTAFAANHLDVVKEVEREYLEAGSQLIYCPTFNLNREKVEGMGETVESLTLKLTEPARQLREEYAAKGRNILVAFDVGPQGELVEPLGNLTFEDAYAFYAEEAKAAVACEVDLVTIETMTDIYDVKAAVLAFKENTDLPVIVTMSFEENGRTFTGTGIETMALILEGLGVDAMGINCSLGPAQILPLMKELQGYTNLPIVAKPNAGLPDPKTGGYDIGCNKFIDIMKQYIDAGVDMVGGCCGTTPEYIRGMAEYIQTKKSNGEKVGGQAQVAQPSRQETGPLANAIDAAHKPHDVSLPSLFGFEEPEELQTNVRMTGITYSANSMIPLKVCSGSKVVTVDHVTVIGERLNPTGKKKLKEALLNIASREADGSESGSEADGYDYLISQAMSQIDAGAEILDVNVGVPGLDEVAMMPKIVKRLQSVTDLPLQIDSSNPDAIEAALRVYNGKAIVNSVNGDEEVMNRVLPIVKKYGAAVIGLTLDSDGIPETCEKRFEIAERIVRRAKEYGIPHSNIIIDCLTLTASAQQKEVDETLKTVRMVTEKLGLPTALGVSNVSFGLPLRQVVNRTFMTMALENGLALPIINPNDEDMMASIYAFNVLKNNDEGAAAFIARYQDKEIAKAIVPKGTAKASKAAKSASTEGASSAKSTVAPQHSASAGMQDGTSGQLSPVAYAVDRGLEGETAKAVRELLEAKDAMAIVNEDLIPALDRVGKGFEKGDIFLPSMMQSAQAAQAGFEVIKKMLDEQGTNSESAGDVVIATVKGDIHDIGKNIVKVIMENYGFNMIDLGRDVPIEKVVETVQSERIRLVGLSALMTTTLASMEDTIKAVKEANLNCKVMVGGAVLTADYAKQIGADYYCADAMKSVEAAQEVFA